MSHRWSWQSRKSKFNLNKKLFCYFFLSLFFNYFYSAVMLDLFVEALRQVMLEELYPTVAAGLVYEIEASEKGLIVKARGFNQKLPVRNSNFSSVVYVTSLSFA